MRYALYFSPWTQEKVAYVIHSSAADFSQPCTYSGDIVIASEVPYEGDVYITKYIYDSAFNQAPITSVDDHIVIIRGGERYDVTGKKIQ